MQTRTRMNQRASAPGQGVHTQPSTQRARRKAPVTEPHQHRRSDPRGLGPAGGHDNQSSLWPLGVLTATRENPGSPRGQRGPAQDRVKALRRGTHYPRKGSGGGPGRRASRGGWLPQRGAVHLCVLTPNTWPALQSPWSLTVSTCKMGPAPPPPSGGRSDSWSEGTAFPSPTRQQRSLQALGGWCVYRGRGVAPGGRASRGGHAHCTAEKLRPRERQRPHSQAEEEGGVRMVPQVRAPHN